MSGKDAGEIKKRRVVEKATSAFFMRNLFRTGFSHICESECNTLIDKLIAGDIGFCGVAVDERENIG